jgi:hypothetical protein
MMFDLYDYSQGKRIYHKSELGEFILSSDAITHTYSCTRLKKMQEIIDVVPKEHLERFYELACTIGSYCVFPAKKVDNKNTINQARGMNVLIKDRFDLTLECIRRYYKNEESPLYQDLKRYNEFFMLFADFKGCCDFFLLQDLVSGDYSQVNFYLPFDDFKRNPLPIDKDEYMIYSNKTIEFIEKRNARIKIYSQNKRM